MHARFSFPESPRGSLGDRLLEAADEMEIKLYRQRVSDDSLQFARALVSAFGAGKDGAA